MACRWVKSVKWVDQMYEPLNSMQAIYGAIGSYWNEEPDEKGCYTMRDLKPGETAGELKAKTILRIVLSKELMTYVISGSSM